MLEIELIDQRNNPKEEGLDGLFQAVGEQVLSQQGVDMDASVSVSLVEEEEIQRINREFRGVDRVTDVLSFPMLAGKLKELQDNGEFTKLLALQEENKLLPVGAVWDEFCTRNNVPAGSEWFKDIEDYEKNVQLLRK